MGIITTKEAVIISDGFAADENTAERKWPVGINAVHLSRIKHPVFLMNR